MNNNKILVLGGNGLIGQFISEFLINLGNHVVILDMVDSSTLNKKYHKSSLEIVVSDVISDDVNYLFSSCNKIIFALPEPVCLKVMSSKSHLIKESVHIINTCSTQLTFFKYARTLLPHNPLVGVNFMFSPTLPYKGRSVAIIKEKETTAYTFIRDLIKENGMVTLEYDPDNHDKIVSLVQTLPHFLTLLLIDIINKYDFSIEEVMKISPPPMLTMLAISARMTTNSPEVYWDIQNNNPYSGKVRADVAHSISALKKIVEDDCFNDFSLLLEEHKDFLGESLSELNERCNNSFKLI